jgi:hypothetical protein
VDASAKPRAREWSEADDLMPRYRILGKRDGWDGFMRNASMAVPVITALSSEMGKNEVRTNVWSMKRHGSKANILTPVACDAYYPGLLELRDE